MAWWQIWRSASTEQHRTDPPDVSAGFPTHTYPPETGNDASETGGDASGTGGVTEREPQGWRLTPPLTLSSDRAMPVTANPALQRMLASHIPVPQLAATARPMGHDRRIDGPIGTVSSVMRTVSSSPDALMASTHVVGGDLVLRRKPLASADESTLPVGPVRRTASGVRLSGHPTPGPALGP